MAVDLPVRTDTYANYSFDVDLEGALYTFIIRWNERDQHYYFDLQDDTGAYIQSGTKIVLGVDMFRKNVNPSRPPGQLLAISLEDGGDPGLGELGNRVSLSYLTRAEAEANV